MSVEAAGDSESVLQSLRGSSPEEIIMVRFTSMDTCVCLWMPLVTKLLRKCWVLRLFLKHSSSTRHRGTLRINFRPSRTRANASRSLTAARLKWQRYRMSSPVLLVSAPDPPCENTGPAHASTSCAFTYSVCALHRCTKRTRTWSRRPSPSCKTRRRSKPWWKS